MPGTCPYPSAKKAGLVYVALGAAYGAWKGVKYAWRQWQSSRPVDTGHELVDSITTAGRNAANFVGAVTVHAAGGAAMTVAWPVVLLASQARADGGDSGEEPEDDE